MRLALYSSGLHHADKTIDEAVWQLLHKPTHPRLLLLVASPDAFNFVSPAFTNYLHDFCSPEYQVILPTSENRDATINAIEQSDLIFLSGGNTYNFLNNLRNLQLIDAVKKAAHTKVIAGSSAGAILMTPSIEIAGYPVEDADSNDCGVTDFSALSLVKFEITPHYVASEAIDKQFREYSMKSGRPLYALADGTGIIVEGNKDQLFGNILMFDHGEKIKVQCSL